jgi:hypothetical protein
MDSRANRAPLLVWWIIWAANLSGLVIVYTLLGGQLAVEPGSDPFARFFCLVPFGLSCVLRWAVMPGQRNRAKALVIFILGLATAEGCGLMGILLAGGFNRHEFFALGVVGILQWMPTFARRFEQPAADKAHGLRSP